MDLMKLVGYAVVVEQVLDAVQRCQKKKLDLEAAFYFANKVGNHSFS